MIEMYVLEQLAAVARCGTLSAAAQVLHITQPALSRAMQKLESETGVFLFERTGNSIRLNALGEEAARRAEDILSREKDMTRTLREMDRRTRTISIGACAPMPMIELQQLLGRTVRSEVISAELNTPERLLEGLRSGAYDVVAVNEPVGERGWVCERLFSEQLYVYLPPEHPLAGRASVSFADLRGETVITNSAIGVWRDLHYRCMPGVRFIELVDRDDLHKLRDHSTLVSFATDRSLERFGMQPPRVAVPFSEPEACMTFYAVYRGDDRRMRSLGSCGGADSSAT